ncbi:MAG: hypothetical protein ABI919_06350 [Ramlibacter sp.]
MTLTNSSSELLPPITPHFVMKVGHVPVIGYQRPGAPEVAVVVAQVIARYGAQGAPLRAIMLERLGPMSGKTARGRQCQCLRNWRRPRN